MVGVKIPRVASAGAPMGLIALCQLSMASAPVAGTAIEFRADRANEIDFDPAPAKFVRLVIEASHGGEPCLDELEVFGEDARKNLALAAAGARAGASSCLPGYAIHKVEHLNDGKYGNSHSWIAAGASKEWAQIELPEPATVAKVVISRDRKGVYHDRLPRVVELRLSMDGRNWRTVRRIKTVVPPPLPSGYRPPAALPEAGDWEGLLRYAFRCERHTWRRMDSSDHLSPLRVERPAVPGGPPYWGRIARLDPLDRVVELMDDMARRLSAKGLDVSRELEQVAAFRRRRAERPDEAAGDALYMEARLAKRRLMLRDPDLRPVRRILFAKRHPYHASHNYSDVLDSQFRPGGGICVLEAPRRDGRLEPAEAKLSVLFDAADGIARDPVADFAGDTIYFAFRPSESPVSGEGCYWRLMALRAGGSELRPLSDGPFHDFFPCPLPDGGLAFVSTRCKCRFLCWRPQAFVLFRMQPDGSAIRPLSFANLSEWTPAMMRDGRILWTRSEYVDKGADFGHTLWAIRPDGAHPQLIYGNNTPNCYMNAHEVPGTNELVCTIVSHGGDHNGPIGLIDPAKGRFDPAALTNITPDVTPRYNMNWARYECFRDPVPVARDYFLASHAPGERFGIYLLDRYGNRELIYLDPHIGSMRPTLLRARRAPPALPGGGDPGLAARGLGQFVMADVHLGLEPEIPRGAVRFLRVCEEVRAGLRQLPNGEYQNDHPSFQDWYATPIHKVSGPHGWPSYVAKASLGLVPVEADGSANFYAPAGKVLYFQALDEHLNELQRMRSVIQLQPGEQRSCIGCHEGRHSTPPGVLPLAARRPPDVLDPPPWGAEPFSYERVVQPVWDAHCVRCHDKDDAHRINLAGVLDGDKVPASYRTLIEQGWVHYFDWRYAKRHHKASPRSFGTLQSKLCRLLEAGHHKVQLSGHDLRRLKCWIDLNCPLWPDYQHRPERGKP